MKKKVLLSVFGLLSLFALASCSGGSDTPSTPDPEPNNDPPHVHTLSTTWSSDGTNHSANGSFLFTLTNNNGTAPTKFPNTQNYEWAVYHRSDYGPTFGGNHDLYISNNYLNNKSSYCSLGYSYPDVLGQGNSIFSGDINTTSFKLKELEVFKLFN